MAGGTRRGRKTIKVTITISKTLDESWGADDLVEACEGWPVTERDKAIQEFVEEDMPAFLEGAHWDIKVEYALQAEAKK